MHTQIHDLFCKNFDLQKHTHIYTHICCSVYILYESFIMKHNYDSVIHYYK
jgi:hypothetical protein